MKRLSAVALTFVLLAAVHAQPGAPPPPSKLDLKEAKAGEVIYVRYCASCHGLSMKGDGAVASGLKNVPTDLTILSATNKGAFPYDRVASIIDGRTTSRIHGTPDMPVWGEIFAVTTGTEAPSAQAAVRRITHHVWSRQVKAAPAPLKK
jgi:mono/diheme cytochrome c family protein